MKIRKRLKSFTAIVIVTQIYQFAFPIAALALTSGPSQPESQQFASAGTSDMVDLFTGDMSYNIPLLDVEGYPINLSYSAGISMDQEASWVGLGWNINPGAINRQLRGVPDDFNGDRITQAQSMKDNVTASISLSANLAEMFGWVDIPATLLMGSLGIQYNTYSGFGYTLGIDVPINAGGMLSGGLGLNYGSESGLGLSPTISTESIFKKADLLAVDIGAGVNSRQGIQYLKLDKGDHANSRRLANVTNRLLRNNSAIGYSFASPSYFPITHVPRENFAIRLSLKAGTELFGLFPNGTISGNFYQESILDEEISPPSYGSLYTQNGILKNDVILDFAREKDIPVGENSITVALPYGTFDIFSVTGQGVSGSYQIATNFLGTFHDRTTTVQGSNLDLGAEFGSFNLLHAGFDVSGIFTNSTTGIWKEGNEFNAYAEPFSNTNTLAEPVYFRNAGELPVATTSVASKMGYSYTAAVDINNINGFARNILNLENAYGPWTGTWPISSNIQDFDRSPRQQVLSYLTSDEADKYGLDKKILNYPQNTLIYADCSGTEGLALIDSLPRVSPSNKDHMSEITITESDGKRYIYGVPASNKLQIESTFSVNGNFANVGSGMVRYSPSVDDSPDNEQGKDHYFEKKYIPEYAHSFLLTAVLSPDYIDVSGDGVTIDDKGQAYRFNYSKLNYDYKWRTPMGDDSASYNQGMQSIDSDDKGSYVYGEKEIWYVHSIESKNMIAQFYLSDRNDALGVVDSSGGITSSMKLKKLDSIKLYSKSDILTYGNNAIAIKTVHFVYDYTLCSGVPNNLNSPYGKLTLNSIYFTYGNSSRGELNKYHFHYENAKSYGTNKTDRWGSYTDHDMLSGYFPDDAEYPDEADFPYTIQNKDSIDFYSSMWNLTSIDLPSGSTITINYESDDYAYVQSKRAGQMFFVKGFKENLAVETYSNLLYNGIGEDANNEYMFISLPEVIDNKEDFYDKYLAGIDYLFYNFQVELTNGTYERVSGYCEFEDWGRVNDHEGWLKIKIVEDKQAGEVHPISLNAWQTLRLNLPSEAYPGSEIEYDGNPEDFIMSLVSIFTSLGDLLFGFNEMAQLQNRGRHVDLNNSWVRLNNPNFSKLGGGHRVKKISIADNWGEMTSGETFSYGQEYEYTTKLEDGTSVSSGVATYEPMIGGDEISLRRPVYYSDKVVMSPNNLYYSELPLGESLFPGAMVGYSKVTVRNIQHNGVTKNGTGYNVKEFFTAKDFPVKTHHTEMDVYRNKPNPIFAFLQIFVKDFMTVSQGFSVEVNDMHGKISSESVYDETGQLISQKKYHYKVEEENVSPLKLVNNCDVVYSDGSIGSASIGVEYSIWQDMREQYTKTTGGGSKVNVETFAAPTLPAVAIVPSVFPSIVNTENRFRSSATTKLIKRFGILDRIEVYDKGSVITTENLLWDALTGQVLLTKVNNEFKDEIFKFTYPAHWIYSGMGPAYENVGAIFKEVTISNGSISLTSPENYFLPGDEVIITNSEIQEVLTVIQPASSLVFVDRDGYPYTKFEPDGTTLASLNLKIKKSGKRNQSAMAAGSITSLINPIDTVNNKIDISDASKIISADAIEYEQEWRKECTDLVTICNTLAPPESSCLSAFIDSAFTNNQIETSFDDGLSVFDILNGSAACTGETSLAFDDEPFYILEGTSSINNYTVTSIGILEIPSFISLKAQMASCVLHFVNYFGEPLPMGNYYSMVNPSSPEELPDGAIEIRLANGIDPVWTEAYHPQDIVGYFYVECKECYRECVDFLPGDTINPYHENMLGVWRPKRSYVYHGLRTPETTVSSTNVKSDGYYEDFQEFYSYNSGTESWDINNSEDAWIWTEESEMFDRFSNEVQSRNALDIYSSALFGYRQSLPVAVANNARIRQIAADNFEDYDFIRSCDSLCTESHWSFAEAINGTSQIITVDTSHTGNRSLRLPANDSVFVSRTIQTYSGDPLNPETNLYTLGDYPCIDKFSPDSGEYLISLWVMVDTACHCDTYIGDFLQIDVDYSVGSDFSQDFQSSGPIIDGWQQVVAKFSVDENATSIAVKLRSHISETTYFDDIRVHPFNGNMRSFVYDARSLRLMAEMDENNYATFYEYDEEGNLARIKKETERGIKTIQENRSHIKSN